MFNRFRVLRFQSKFHYKLEWIRNGRSEKFYQCPTGQHGTALSDDSMKETWWVIIVIQVFFIFSSDGNLPRAWGAKSRRPTLALPALSPTMVTQFGSPPKYLINWLVHRRASIWSKMPALPGISSVLSDKKPSGPSRYCTSTMTTFWSMYFLELYNRLPPDEKEPPWIQKMTGSRSSYEVLGSEALPGSCWWNDSIKEVDQESILIAFANVKPLAC